MKLNIPMQHLKNIATNNKKYVEALNRVYYNYAKREDLTAEVIKSGITNNVGKYDITIAFPNTWEIRNSGNTHYILQNISQALETSATQVAVIVT